MHMEDIVHVLGVLLVIALVTSPIFWLMRRIRSHPRHQYKSIHTVELPPIQGKKTRHHRNVSIPTGVPRGSILGRTQDGMRCSMASGAWWVLRSCAPLKPQPAPWAFICRREQRRRGHRGILGWGYVLECNWQLQQ
eukprot:FR736978.1.p1 GENE.FR736978.1~~FR736978.1.p1  ORF type:complete len:136 (+),score=3.27 FR736978.1:348-755(+)